MLVTSNMRQLQQAVFGIATGDALTSNCRAAAEFYACDNDDDTWRAPRLMKDDASAWGAMYPALSQAQESSSQGYDNGCKHAAKPGHKAYANSVKSRWLLSNASQGQRLPLLGCGVIPVILPLPLRQPLRTACCRCCCYP